MDNNNLLWLLLHLSIALVLAGCEGTADAPGGSHSITISWAAPTQRSDNSVLNPGDIDGYVINYGQTSGGLTETININNPSAIEYTVTGLPSGTWYFTVQTRDVEGQLSVATTEQPVTLE